MIKKVQIKPTVHEAVQWTGNNHKEIYEFTDCFINEEKIVIIPNTMHEPTYAKKGDWIIKDEKINGVFVCSDEAFEYIFQIVE